MVSLETTSFLAALGTIALQIFSIALLVVYIMRARTSVFTDISAVVGKYALSISFAISLTATLAAVYYSNGLGLEPCPLCWWQRVALFPQVVLFAIAMWKGDRRIAIYSVALSLIGAAIGLYQHALQMLPGSGLPCPATGVSCAQRFVFEFGYITFPLMAVSVFATLIVLMLFARLRD